MLPFRHLFLTSTVIHYLIFSFNVSWVCKTCVFSLELHAPFYGFHLTLITFSQSKLTSNMSTDSSDIKMFNVNASVVKEVGGG